MRSSLLVHSNLPIQGRNGHKSANVLRAHFKFGKIELVPTQHGDQGYGIAQRNYVVDDDAKPDYGATAEMG